MKLATYRDDSRDGQLVVVSQDLSTAHFAAGIAGRLQQALDDWNFISPQLEDLYLTLNHGKARHAFAFEPGRCMAPLPRAFQWLDAPAYEPPRDAAPAEPVLIQRAGDRFLGPRDEAVFDAAAGDIDAAAMLAVVCADVATGSDAWRALESVRLMMLGCDWTQRESAGRVAIATAFAPVAVTMDELGDAWAGGKPQLAVQYRRGDAAPVRLEAGGDAMAFHYGQLIAARSRVRGLSAGTIVTAGAIGSHSGAVGGHDIPAPGAASGAAPAGSVDVGATIRIEATGRDGQSLFGAIVQTVVRRP